MKKRYINKYCYSMDNMKVCPKCGSSNITLYMGGKFGKYECKNCGYIGALVIEKEDEIKEI